MERFCNTIYQERWNFSSCLFSLNKKIILVLVILCINNVSIAVANATDHAARCASDVVLTETRWMKPSPLPDTWKLKGIFATGVILGTYLDLMTVVFFWVVHSSDDLSRIRRTPGYLHFDRLCPATTDCDNHRCVCQLGICENPWNWMGMSSIIFYIPLDFLKFIIRYALSGKAWDNLLQNMTAFTSKRIKENERGCRHELLINASCMDCILLKTRNSSMIRATTESYLMLLNRPGGALRSLAAHGLLRELHTLYGHVESVVIREKTYHSTDKVYSSNYSNMNPC
ncbi:hypothetical protein SADUNF_Sadunf05G0138700 [Salix dunnii]|uniref:Uncharacterized protein n=1 Tax=Salix dunnii TaxID=1413687 RepID=A0A835K1Y6_9ROSI|nr:hypothetical protein SADUNF_Sadunf05G0138700 [Salix dunnii]